MSNYYPAPPSEARIFVRHTDGSSLIVPEQNPDEIERLSFSIPLDGNLGTSPLKQVEALQDDEDANMNFFHIQHSLGLELSIDGYGRSSAGHGFLAQSRSPKAPDIHSHTKLSLADAKDLMNHSPAVESIDRRLAHFAFNVIAHGSVQLGPIYKRRAELEQPPQPREQAARRVVSATAISNLNAQKAYGTGALDAEAKAIIRANHANYMHAYGELLPYLGDSTPLNATLLD